MKVRFEYASVLVPRIEPASVPAVRAEYAQPPIAYHARVEYAARTIFAVTYERHAGGADATEKKRGVLFEQWWAAHRDQMPESARALADVRRVFGEPRRVRFEENGIVASWAA